MKAQCMHCVDPACVYVCMMGSLEKREFGIVTWHGERCTGCRYCGVACPFGVPKYECDKAFPAVVKCEMCRARGRQAGPAAGLLRGLPAARRHLRQARGPAGRGQGAGSPSTPSRYEPKVFGETDGGGTQVLYLTAGRHRRSTSSDCPTSGPRAGAASQQNIQHALYQGFVAPVALLAVFGGVIWRNRRMQAADGRGGGTS